MLDAAGNAWRHACAACPASTPRHFLLNPQPPLAGEVVRVIEPHSEANSWRFASVAGREPHCTVETANPGLYRLVVLGRRIEQRARKDESYLS